MKCQGIQADSTPESVNPDAHWAHDTEPGDYRTSAHQIPHFPFRINKVAGIQVQDQVLSSFFDGLAGPNVDGAPGYTAMSGIRTVNDAPLPVLSASRLPSWR